MSANTGKRPQVSLFSKMPIKWIQDGELVKFGNRPTPTAKKALKLQNGSIAALKLYMTLCIKTTFGTGEVNTTYNKLIALSGMSRPVIARALKRLVEEGLITKKSQSLCEGSSIYINGWLEQSYYGMLPKRWLHDDKGMTIMKLIDFNYSTVSLYALKVYLVLIGFRDRHKNGLAVISYNAISRYTGVPKYRVAEAITKLYDMNLISYRQADFTDLNEDEIDRTNRYLVKGLNITWTSLNQPSVGAKSVAPKKPSERAINAANAFASGGRTL
jgi:hypothetical protein